MGDLVSINTKVRTFIQGVLGLPIDRVRPSNQVGPVGQPSENFATVFISELGPVGSDVYQYNPDASIANNVLESILGTRSLMASVNFYKAGALTLASRFHALAFTSRAIALLNAQNLGLYGISRVRNLTALIDTSWEERAQIDIEIYLLSKETVTLETYGSFPITATVGLLSVTKVETPP